MGKLQQNVFYEDFYWYHLVWYHQYFMFSRNNIIDNDCLIGHPNCNSTRVNSVVTSCVQRADFSFRL